jgi:hypothetical protein
MGCGHERDMHYVVHCTVHSNMNGTDYTIVCPSERGALKALFDTRNGTFTPRPVLSDEAEETFGDIIDEL